MSDLGTVGALVGIVGGALGAIALVAGEIRARNDRASKKRDAARRLPLLIRERADKLADSEARERKEHTELVGGFVGRGTFESSYRINAEADLRARFERERRETEREYDPEIARLEEMVGEEA